MIAFFLVLLLVGIIFYLLLGSLTVTMAFLSSIAILIKYTSIIPWAAYLRIKEKKENSFLYYFMYIDLKFPKDTGFFTNYFLAPKAKNAIVYGKVLNKLKTNGC